MKPRILLITVGAPLLVLIALALGRASPASAGEPFVTSTQSWDVAMCIQNTLLGASTYICTSENNGSVSNPTFADHGTAGVLDAGDNAEEASNAWLYDAVPAVNSQGVEPYFDALDSVWQKAGIIATPSQANGGALVDGDWVGQIRFTISSNLTFATTNNINTTTGQPPPILYKTSGVSHLGDTFKLFAADTGTAGDGVYPLGAGLLPGRVGHTDDPGGFKAQYTVEDNVNATGTVVAGGNGIFDGVDLVPDALDNLWASTGLGPALISRAFGKAKVVPGLGVDMDVNFIVYDMTILAGGPADFMSQQTVGYPWLPSTAPTANNVTDHTVQTAPPFLASPVRIFGMSVGNFTRCDALTCGAQDAGHPAPAIAGGVANRTIGNASLVDYRLYFSVEPDYDGDNIANTYDRCRYDPNSGATDSNGNGLSGICDPTAEAAQTFNQICPNGDPYAGTMPTAPPFTVDQDLDCDDILNTVDNCPLVQNPLQGDSDRDGVGDACDPAPYIVGNGSGYYCNGTVSGGSLPNVACDASTKGVRDADNLCDDQIALPSTPGEPAGENGSAPGTSPPGTTPYKYCLAGRTATTTNTDDIFHNPVMNPTSNAVMNNSILPMMYRDSNDDRKPDFFDQYFIGLAPNTLSNVLYDAVSDSDSDGYSDACETLLAREGDPLNPLVYPGLPSLPGDCDGDGTSDVDESRGLGDGNPFVRAGWVQTGEGGVAGNCNNNVDDDGDGFKDASDRECVPSGSWDADGDCRLDATETGGGKNMYNTFDFPNVPTNPPLNLGAGMFDGKITGLDLSALLQWGPAKDNDVVLSSGADYDSDNNGDHRDDGRDYDFASSGPGELGFGQDGQVGGTDLSKLLATPSNLPCG
jgi:hypothetical protein